MGHEQIEYASYSTLATVHVGARCQQRGNDLNTAVVRRDDEGAAAVARCMVDVHPRCCHERVNHCWDEHQEHIRSDQVHPSPCMQHVAYSFKDGDGRPDYITSLKMTS